MPFGCDVALLGGSSSDEVTLAAKPGKAAATPLLAGLEIKPYGDPCLLSHGHLFPRRGGGYPVEPRPRFETSMIGRFEAFPLGQRVAEAGGGLFVSVSPFTCA